RGQAANLRRWLQRSFRKFWKDRLLMFRNRRILLAALAAAGLCMAQDRRAAPRIDVEQYTIDAEISPNTQTLEAKATVRFVPADDTITSASLDVNNGLNVSPVCDA